MKEKQKDLSITKNMSRDGSSRIAIAVVALGITIVTDLRLVDGVKVREKNEH
jgi:hypothetical protein